MENGRFGALRPKSLPGPPPCATTQIIPVDDPRNPAGADVHCVSGVRARCDCVEENQSAPELPG
ncbi:MAG: hypothetical protein ACXVH1_23055 [Solirubrobacteraceae bacterium]